MVDKISSHLMPGQVPGQARGRPQAASSTSDRSDFAAVLRREVEAGKVRFSNHAEARLRARNIHLSPEQRERIERAVEAADRKGAKESLILLDDVALVVSIRNRTVITAIDARHRRSNVFTHIDSAVLA